jgi:hypothetical protein
MTSILRIMEGLNWSNLGKKHLVILNEVKHLNPLKRRDSSLRSE